jgi:glycerophosphoryl diester phosphodiesterase
MYRTSLVALVAGGLAAPMAAQAAPTYNTPDGSAPLVIGHRGASGCLPEQALESYRLAIQQGAHYVEPDLVMTQDGVIIARHEPMIDDTTDVVDKFRAVRSKTTRLVDGVSTTAHFASDFTLAETRTLGATQSRAGRSQCKATDPCQIPTLDEAITLAKAQSTLLGRPVGIYPEVKHSTFHDGIFGARAFENKLVEQLHSAYGNSGSAPVFIQSFEVNNLQQLNGRTDIKLVQLVDADDVKPDRWMSLVAPYAQPYDFVVGWNPAPLPTWSRPKAWPW